MPDKVYSKRRAVEVRPDEYADEIYVRDAWNAGISLGNAYLLSTGRIDTGQAGIVRVLLESPSTLTTTLLGAAVYTTGAGWVDIMRNPTTGLPTTAGRSFDMNPYTGAGPEAVLLWDIGTTRMGGETERETVTGVPGSQRTVISPLGIIIAPGGSFGIEVDFAARSDAIITCYTVEKA